MRSNLALNILRLRRRIKNLREESQIPQNELFKPKVYLTAKDLNCAECSDMESYNRISRRFPGRACVLW